MEDLGKMIKSMKKVSAFFICLVTKALLLSFSLQLILGLILAYEQIDTGQTLISNELLHYECHKAGFICDNIW